MSERQNNFPKRKAKFPPMTQPEMLAAENERASNKLHRGNNAELSARTETVLNEMRNMPERIKLVDGTVAPVKALLFQNLEACISAGTLPSWQSACRCLGHSRQSVHDFMTRFPTKPLAEFLSLYKDALSQLLDEAALNNDVNVIVAIFLAKVHYQYVDKSELFINTAVMDNNPLGDIGDPDELARRYLPETIDED